LKFAAMRKFLLILFLLLSLRTVAQSDYFNTEDFWKTVQLEEKMPAIKPDTAIIVVSSRQKTKDKLRYMSEHRDGKELHYFFVYASQNNWHVVPVKNISEALQYIPHKEKDWVVYTEGMGKIFTSDVDRGMRLAEQYNVNVVLFDYPSITTTKSKLGNYRFAIHHARGNYKDFVPALDTIRQLHTQNQMGSGHLSLFFHSMGNNMVKKIVKKKKLAAMNDTKWVSNIILNAPCVYQSHHSKWLDKINFANAIYIHYNPEDHTLKGAHLVSFHKQLGEMVRNPICKKAYYINFNALCATEHSNFLTLYGRTNTKPEAFAHYNTLFHGDTVNVYNSPHYKPTAYKKIGWDILP
jgi:hypothetical protein